jgi:hypothetical protein
VLCLVGLVLMLGMSTAAMVQKGVIRVVIVKTDNPAAPKPSKTARRS